MILLFIIKVLGDLFYYFAFIASLSNHITISCPLVLPAVIYATSTGLSQILLSSKKLMPILNNDKKNIAAKSLSMIPCLLTLLLASTLTDFIFLIPPIIYVGLIIFREKYQLLHRVYIEYFINMLRLSLLIFLVCVLALNWRSFLIYMSGFVTCGIFLMRQLRLYSGNDMKSNFVNISSMLSIVFISGGGFGIIYITLQNFNYIWSVIRYPLSLLLYLISALLKGLLWIFNNFIGLFGGSNVEIPTVEFSKANDIIMGSAKSSQINEQPILQTILIIAAVIVILIIIFKMLKGLQKNDITFEENTDFEIIKPAPSSKKPRTSKLFKNNREKVRMSYIKYLKCLEKDYGKFAGSNTSWDIYEKTAHYSDNKKALQLRDIYLHARYDSEKEVSQSEVQAAKKLAKEFHK